MGSETKRRAPAGLPDGPEAILAFVRARLEAGDPEAIVPALDDLAGAMVLQQDPPAARSDLASVVAALKGLGLELTVKAA